VPKIIDATVPLSAEVPTFPGDPRFHMEFSHRIDRGEPYNVARLTLGAHSGTHVDAPYHFLGNGATVERLPLDVLVGPALVADVGSAARVDVAELEGIDLDGETRLLLKTRMSGQLLRPDFQEDFVYLTAEAAAHLVERGIRLVGIDYLSVERFGSEDFGAHHTLLRAGVVIVEGLDLSDAAAGRYQMACLPLRIVGADGSPARVVLWEDSRHTST
jgi:arylformamidase